MQETWKYEKLILQHMDLETVETRLKEGCYSGSAAKFFRDLLLLVNNALVFYPKNSAEATAAAEIRRLISRLHSSQPPSSSLIVCRKRTSVAAKSDEPKITKKRRRDRFPPSINNNIGKAKQGQPGKGGDSKKSQSTSDYSKKRGAVNFLNRMKQGNNGVLVDALKNTPLTTSENAKKEEARQTKEKEKRNVGRPPKRGGAPPPAAVGKRGKDRGEVEEAASKQGKKKSRKL